MSENDQNQEDVVVQQIKESLAAYKQKHVEARIDVKRQNSVSVRIRIIDPHYQGMTRVDREPEVWKLLDELPEETLSEITMLLLISPKEAKNSLANMEFEDPIPSRL